MLADHGVNSPDAVSGAHQANLERVHRHVGDHGKGLIPHQVGIDSSDAQRILCALSGQAGNDRSGVAAESEKCLDIGLNAGTPGGIKPGETHNCRFGVLHYSVGLTTIRTTTPTSRNTGSSLKILKNTWPRTLRSSRS